jgi:MFS family permease
MGCITVASPLLISETFGVRSFGKLMGVLGIPATLGMAVGQFLSGWLYRLQSNYQIAFSAFALAYLLCGISLVFVRPYFLESTGRRRSLTRGAGSRESAGRSW